MRESEWDDEQRAWMVALAEYRAGLCRRCGHEMAESTDPLHDPDNPAGTHVYLKTRTLRCHACTALMQADRQYSDPGNGMAPSPFPAALQHHVQLVPRAPAAKERKPRQRNG